MFRIFFSVIVFLGFVLWVNAAIDFGVDNVSEDLSSTELTLVQVLENVFQYVIWLFYFISIIFGVYSWFQIITSWWDEEKFKKWKSTLWNVVIWLIVIFLSSSLINWLIEVFTSEEIIG